MRPLALLVMFATFASATTMKEIVCSVVQQVYDTLAAVGPALVILMFTYGGVKYVFSADDPGGRKQGKMTCIHAIIGGILLVLAYSVLSILGLTDKITTYGLECGTIPLT